MAARKIKMEWLPTRTELVSVRLNVERAAEAIVSNTRVVSGDNARELLLTARDRLDGLVRAMDARANGCRAARRWKGDTGTLPAKTSIPALMGETKAPGDERVRQGTKGPEPTDGTDRAEGGL